MSAEAEEKVVDVDPEILARYVGTYEGLWLGRLITVEVTLEDGALSMRRNPRYISSATDELRLIAQSDTAFECSCGLGFVFTAEHR